MTCLGPHGMIAGGPGITTPCNPQCFPWEMKFMSKLLYKPSMSLSVSSHYPISIWHRHSGTCPPIPVSLGIQRWATLYMIVMTSTMKKANGGSQRKWQIANSPSSTFSRGSKNTAEEQTYSAKESGLSWVGSSFLNYFLLNLQLWFVTRYMKTVLLLDRDIVGSIKKITIFFFFLNNEVLVV